MAAEFEEAAFERPRTPQRDARAAATAAPSTPNNQISEEDDSDDDDEEEGEPRLKYTRLTDTLGPVYRNGDATSAFTVAGDKLVGQQLNEETSDHGRANASFARCLEHIMAIS